MGYNPSHWHFELGPAPPPFNLFLFSSPPHYRSSSSKVSRHFNSITSSSTGGSGSCRSVNKRLTLRTNASPGNKKVPASRVHSTLQLCLPGRGHPYLHLVRYKVLGLPGRVAKSWFLPRAWNFHAPTEGKSESFT